MATGLTLLSFCAMQSWIYKVVLNKLNDFEYKNTSHYFNKLHKNSPYIPPTTIGYDFNYNKFIKHGIELRIFDSFPEEYLEDIIGSNKYITEIDELEKNVENS